MKTRWRYAVVGILGVAAIGTLLAGIETRSARNTQPVPQHESALPGRKFEELRRQSPELTPAQLEQERAAYAQRQRDLMEKHDRDRSGGLDPFEQAAAIADVLRQRTSIC